MRYVGPNVARRASRRRRRRSRRWRASRRMYQLARKAITERKHARAGRERGAARCARRATPSCCATDACCRRSRIPIRRIAWCRGTGLTHLGSAAARDSMHAKIDKQDNELTDSMKMFKWGVEGGKPTGSKPGMQPEWFYKGNGRNVVACGSALAVARLRRGSWRGARARRPLPHRRQRPAAPSRLRDRQRVLGSRHRAPQLSTAGAFEAAPVRRRARCSTPARCPRTWKAPAASAATARCCGRSRSSPARRTCATPSPISNTTTSSTGSTACPATCTCISSAPRRVSFVDNIKVQAGDEFEVDLPALGRAARQSAGHRARRPCAARHGRTF